MLELNGFQRVVDFVLPLHDLRHSTRWQVTAIQTPFSPTKDNARDARCEHNKRVQYCLSNNQVKSQVWVCGRRFQLPRIRSQDIIHRNLSLVSTSEKCSQSIKGRVPKADGSARDVAFQFRFLCLSKLYNVLRSSHGEHGATERKMFGTSAHEVLVPGLQSP